MTGCSIGKDDGIADANRIHLYAAEHRMIYEAIVQRDAESARFHVEQHIQRVRRSERRKLGGLDVPEMVCGAGVRLGKCAAEV